MHGGLLGGSEASACLLLALRVNAVVGVRVGCACSCNCSIFICVRLVLEPAFDWVLDGVAPANADTCIVLLALNGREQRILCQLLLVWRWSHLLLCGDDRTHLSILHEGQVTVDRVVIRPVMADLLALPLDHLADERLNGRLHLILAPELQDPLISLLLRIISHAKCCLVRVVRVQRVAQEIQPFHHHEFHRLVELGRFREALVSLHALTSCLASCNQQVRQLFYASRAGLRPCFLHVGIGSWI